uniref:Uncharacterized protein n=1 Tax=Ralstonia solanacearum TaxID=305 RepID=A0A0S4TMH3_RALSL|nr:protein of unknown function [Ralstonia solanacearum]
MSRSASGARKGFPSRAHRPQPSRGVFLYSRNARAGKRTTPPPAHASVANHRAAIAPSRVSLAISRDRAGHGIEVGLRMTARRVERKSDPPFENRRHSRHMPAWMFA